MQKDEGKRKARPQSFRTGNNLLPQVLADCHQEKRFQRRLHGGRALAPLGFGLWTLD
jgi:hypothetical protein